MKNLILNQILNEVTYRAFDGSEDYEGLEFYHDNYTITAEIKRKYIVDLGNYLQPEAQTLIGREINNLTILNEQGEEPELTQEQKTVIQTEISKWTF